MSETEYRCDAPHWCTPENCPDRERPACGSPEKHPAHDDCVGIPLTLIKTDHQLGDEEEQA